MLRKVAHGLALCMPLVGKEPLTPAELAERQKYGDEAMDVLRLAVKHGIADVGALQKAKELAPLRTRQDFQELIREVEKKARAKAP